MRKGRKETPRENSLEKFSSIETSYRSEYLVFHLTPFLSATHWNSLYPNFKHYNKVGYIPGPLAKFYEDVHFIVYGLIQVTGKKAV